MLSSAIARSLGVKEVPNQSVMETLEEYLSNKEILLVLDNFEHIVPAGPLVTDLITACPGTEGANHEPNGASPVRRISGGGSTPGHA